MDLKETPAVLGLEGSHHPHQLARLALIERLFRHVHHERGADRGTVLDIGCGDAIVSCTLAARYPGLTFIGIDPGLADPVARQGVYRSEQQNVQLFADPAEAPCADGGCGIVLLLDVLEHIEEDGLFLAELAANSVLAPDAALIVTVPAHPALYAEHDRLLEHCRRYTPRGLTAVLETNGWRVRERGNAFASLLLPRVVELLVEKGRPPREQITPWRGGSVLTGLYRDALVADIVVLRALHRVGIDVPGLTSYAVCERKDAP